MSNLRKIHERLEAYWDKLDEQRMARLRAEHPEIAKDITTVKYKTGWIKNTETGETYRSADDE